MNSSLELSEFSPEINWKRVIFLGLGLLLFMLLYLAPPMPDALDPADTRFHLSLEGKAALAIFLLAGIWWVFKVVPIGVTSLAIGLLQVVVLVRPAEEAFGDFMRPYVLFIFASICHRPGIYQDRADPTSCLPHASSRWRPYQQDLSRVLYHHLRH